MLTLFSFEQAITRVEAYLLKEIIPAARVGTIFAQVGGDAFFLPMGLDPVKIGLKLLQAVRT